MLEYKPVERLHARPQGENTGDLKFPAYVFGLLAAVVAIVVLLAVGLFKLLA